VCRQPVKGVSALILNNELAILNLRNRLSPHPLVDLGLPKNSSPLNPNSTPTEKPLPFPSSHEDLFAPSQSPHFRDRIFFAVSDTAGGAVTQATAGVDLSTLSPFP